MDKDSEPPHHLSNKSWAGNMPDPFGRHSIDVGDGRKLCFLRINRFQQVGISFAPTKEGTDAKPSPEETQWLKEHGFTTWRPEFKARTLQLLNPEQKADISSVEVAQGKEPAMALRSKYREANDLMAHQTFVELANKIREKNGLQPVDFVFSDKSTDVKL